MSAPTTKCPLCMGSGDDPDLESTHDGLYGPVDRPDYCRMCEGERVVSTEGVWDFVAKVEMATPPPPDPWRAAWVTLRSWLDQKCRSDHDRAVADGESVYYQSAADASRVVLTRMDHIVPRSHPSGEPDAEATL